MSAMAKRKRSNVPKKSFTAGPMDESTGMRSAFPEVVSLSSERDTEYWYNEEEDEHVEDGLVGQTFNMADMDWTGEDMEIDEEEEEEVDEGLEEGEVEDEWDVEPQTEAIAYLHSVRTEAESLPLLTYTPQDTIPCNDLPPRTTPNAPVQNSSLTDNDEEWRSQFLTYYNTLRTTISTTSVPNLSQDELDKLLHINPSRRPNNSNDEDRLWRIKTMDPPSLTLLAMLDHQRTIHLLTHLRKKLSANVKAEQCMWLIFLLARLGDPGILSGEEVDLLRRIGRKCFVVRSGLEGNEKDVLLGTIDMVVSIIKYYYQQRDLEETYQETV